MTRLSQETQDFAQVLNHVHEAHVGHVAVMDDCLNRCLSFHHVTTQEAELSLGIMLLE